MIILTHINDSEVKQGMKDNSIFLHSFVASPIKGVDNLSYLAPWKEMVYGHKSFSGDERFKHFVPTELQGKELYDAIKRREKPLREVTITDQQYIDLYRLILADKHHWPYVKRWLESLENEFDEWYVCYCPPGKFCHRQLVAKMIQKWRPDIKIELR